MVCTAFYTMDLLGFLQARVSHFCPAHSIVHDVDRVVLHGIWPFSEDEEYIMPCHSPLELYDECTRKVRLAAISSRWVARRLLKEVDSATRLAMPYARMSLH